MSRAIQRHIGGRRVVITFEPGQESMARGVMATLARICGERRPQAGMSVRLGWSLVRLVEDPHDGLILCEPDFDGDPLHQARQGVSTTLAVLRMQSRLCHAVDVQPQDAGFEQFIVVAGGALMLREIQLLRTTTNGPEDSGWSLGPLGYAVAEEDYGAMRLYELLSQRPIVLAVVALPSDFAAVIENETVVAVFDPQGRQRLLVPFTAGGFLPKGCIDS